MNPSQTILSQSLRVSGVVPRPRALAKSAMTRKIGAE